MQTFGAGCGGWDGQIHPEKEAVVVLNDGTPARIHNTSKEQLLLGLIRNGHEELLAIVNGVWCFILGSQIDQSKL